MRAVWSILVVWLLAASGVGRADARRDRQTAPAARAVRVEPSAAHPVAIRAVPHAPVAQARAVERRLPPAALAAAVSLRAPSLRALAAARAPCGRAAARRIATGSARGPPIA